MNTYSERLRELLKTIGKSYVIGLVVAVVFEVLTMGGLERVRIDAIVGFTIVFGSLIGIFLVNKSGVRVGILNTAIKAVTSVFGGMVFAGVGSGIGMVFFVFRLMFGLIVGGILLGFAVICFPVTILYTFVMFLIEKFVGEIDPQIGAILDNVVPIGSAVILFWIVITIL